MADDDERVYAAARAAADQARSRLGRARREVKAVAGEFGKPVGLLSWGTLADKLTKRRACVARYKELQAAISDAEAAIARAEAACAALVRATQQ